MTHHLIQQRLQAAVRSVLPEADVSAVLVRPCPDPKFGDYQTNALMSLQSAPVVTGPYTDVINASSPYSTNLVAGQLYYRLSY